MKLQRLYSLTRQAIDDFHMIEGGDRIAVGISGGKDSLALLYALSGLRNFYPEKFELVAMTVDLGYKNFDLTGVEALCRQLGVEYHVIRTEIAGILKEKIEKGSYCAMCAKLRKGALHTKAKELGCNKIAYAHHMDDMIETTFLSMLYEGQFFTFAPSTYFKEADLTVIRPLIYVKEAEIIGFRNKYELPCVKNPCPYDGITRREYVKNLLRQIYRENPESREKIFHAIMKGEIYYTGDDPLGTVNKVLSGATACPRSDTLIALTRPLIERQAQIKSDSFHAHCCKPDPTDAMACEEAIAYGAPADKEPGQYTIGDYEAYCFR